MKKLRKIFAAAVATMAIAAMSVIPAFAATVTMYGYKDGAYVASPHTDKMVESVEENANGTYTIVFVPITETYNGVTATGYISHIETANGLYAADYDEDEEITVFTFKVGNDNINGENGTIINYNIAPYSEHSTSVGAIVIK